MGHFCPPDPDPDPGTPLNPDPDPQHCFLIPTHIIPLLSILIMHLLSVLLCLSLYSYHRSFRPSLSYFFIPFLSSLFLYHSSSALCSCSYIIFLFVQGTGSQPPTPAGKGEEGGVSAPRHAHKENTAPTPFPPPPVSRFSFDEHSSPVVSTGTKMIIV